VITTTLRNLLETKQDSLMGGEVIHGRELNTNHAFILFRPSGHNIIGLEWYGDLITPIWPPSYQLDAEIEVITDGNLINRLRLANHYSYYKEPEPLIACADYLADRYNILYVSILLYRHRQASGYKEF
jgi:hypothetical protein